MRETKRAYGWPEDAQFLVPDGRQGALRRGGRQPRRRGARGGRASARRLRARTSPTWPPRSTRCRSASCPRAGTTRLPRFEADEKGLATRKASNKVQNAIGERLPWLLGGSADLTDSTSVRFDFDGAADFEPGHYDGRQLHYGIREHESAAISNGLSLSKLRPLWSTYLTFSDYARPAIRLSALMELPVIHLFTHDSIGLGEDGPTHQPVEQLAVAAGDPRPRRDPPRRRQRGRRGVAGRARPQPHQPVALVLTRQDVPVLDRSRYASAEGLRAGRLRARRLGGRERPRRDPDRDRQRGRARARRPRGADRRRHPLAGRQPALLGAVRPPGRGLPRRGAAAGGDARGSRSRRPRPSAGTATSAPAGG